MKRLIAAVLLFALALWSRPLWQPAIEQRAELTDLVDAGEHASQWVAGARETVRSLWETRGASPLALAEPKRAKEPAVDVSVARLKMGMQRTDVERSLGRPQRVSRNEYGTNWFTYYRGDYERFVMIAYDERQAVNAMATVQPDFAAIGSIDSASRQKDVRRVFGEPLAFLQKGLVRYMLPKEGHDTFERRGSYVTFFYDLHAGSKVTAVQVVDKSLESRLRTLYAKPSAALRDGFEKQMRDLINAERKKRALPTLAANERAAAVARAHSADMAERRYFSHTNPDGASPFDRMTRGGLVYRYAGENLAHGQASPLFAHEGLMNSIGHRANILNTHYDAVGIGTAFGQEGNPYYTQNYLQ